ncbi:MAG: hypothetical protein IT376_06470 [Polyangiaceae bacterium]|nr:hypothetical protein [Polyangiaceae bacterium]
MRDARRSRGRAPSGPPLPEGVRAPLALTVVALLACRPSSPPSERDVEAGAAPSSAAQAPAAPRCAALGSGTFTVGESGAVRPPDEDGGEPAPAVPLPFAVEVGAAVATTDGFAVSALRAQQAGTHALVALVGGEVSGGRVVDLGRTHGDVGPPAIAARAGRLAVVVPDGDVHGGRLRLAEIRDGGVVWGGEVTHGHDDSHAFAVALGEERGVVLWDELTGTPGRSAVRAATFAVGDPGSLTRARALTAADEDAEGPEIAARGGGFWVAWVRRAATRRGALRDGPTAAPTGSERERMPDPPAIALERRALVLAPLDAAGALSAAPQVVSAAGAHVLAFDLVAAADGSAIVAWRDDAAGPGIEARTVHLARYSTGGSVARAIVEDDRVGAGVPTLLVDASAPEGATVAWLSLAGLGDEAQLLAFSEPLQPADTLAGEAALLGGEPLAIRGGRFLVGRPRGLAMELFAVACRPGATPADAGTP